MEPGTEDEDLTWFGTVNHRFHISLFPSTEEYVAALAEKEPELNIFSVDPLNHLYPSNQIQMYLLAEENLVELCTRTGMTEETFRTMWRYDMDFGVTTKIYLIPAI